MRSWIRILLVLGLIVARPLGAQENVLDLRFLEVDEDGDRTYHNLVYSGPLGGGRWSLEAFALFLPQLDDYEEFGLGLGYRAGQVGEVSISVSAFLATAPDDDYFQPALLALDVDGKLTGSFFLLHYAPLGDEGIHQWLIDPAEIQYNVGGPVSVGLSGYFYRPQGGSWLRKIGPKLSLADKLGATELALREVNQGGGLEIQLRRILLF